MKFGGASAPVGAPTSLELLMNKDIDPILMTKIEGAVHSTLMTIIRSVTSIGMTPKSAVDMVRSRLDYIETMVKEEEQDAVAHGAVPGDGRQREEAEEAEVVEEQAGIDQGPAGVRGRPAPVRQETHGEWTDDDTARYGVEPRTDPGVDPSQPF